MSLPTPSRRKEPAPLHKIKLFQMKRLEAVMIRTELPERTQSFKIPEDLPWPCKCWSIPVCFNASHQRCFPQFRGETPLESSQYYTDLFETLEHTCPRVYKGSEHIPPMIFKLTELFNYFRTLTPPHVVGSAVKLLKQWRGITIL